MPGDVPWRFSSRGKAADVARLPRKIVHVHGRSVEAPTDMPPKGLLRRFPMPLAGVEGEGGTGGAVAAGDRGALIGVARRAGPPRRGRSTASAGYADADAYAFLRVRGAHDQRNACAARHVVAAREGEPAGGGRVRAGHVQTPCLMPRTAPPHRQAVPLLGRDYQIECSACSYDQALFGEQLRLRLRADRVRSQSAGCTGHGQCHDAFDGVEITGGPVGDDLVRAVERCLCRDRIGGLRRSLVR